MYLIKCLSVKIRILIHLLFKIVLLIFFYWNYVFNIYLNQYKMIFQFFIWRGLSEILIVFFFFK